MDHARLIAALGAPVILMALANCSAGPSQPPTTGHVADGVYILPPEEEAFTCSQFEEEINSSVVKAFANVNDGNRRAVTTIAGNLLSLGMGNIPRGFNFGARERRLGEQDLTKAIALDNAAIARGCSGVDIPALIEAELGEGSLAKVVEMTTGENRQEDVLAEESQAKDR